MSREIKKLLADILMAINAIKEFTKDVKSFNQYEKSNLIRSGVERQLTIVGEAVVKLKNLDKSIVIQNSKEIINLRNRLVHSYD